ncbi:MAG TPA: glycosyltransferase [Acidobacteriota bacterium]|nr:glycosyltransferase [Acidobacteriota bacterium]
MRTRRPQIRIATVNNYYYLRGGAERVLFDEESMLRAHGHEVLPFSAGWAQNFPAETSHYFIGRKNLYRTFSLRSPADAFRLIHNRREGKAFARLLEEMRPELVHCHNIYGTLTTAILDESNKRGIPTIMTVHDAKLVCPSYLCFHRGVVCEACSGLHFYHCMLNRCHKESFLASAGYTIEAYYNKWLRKYETLRCVITPSRFLKALLEKNGYPADWIMYLPNAVDVKRIVPKFQPGKYVLYVGRLSKEKGVLSLLKAIKDTNIPLRIAGDGPVRPEAEAYAQRHKIAHVRFEGYQKDRELIELFENAAFIVMPSECNENGPISLLEAYAYGKPVLGARIGGIPEFIIPGETGDLFESRNVDQLRVKLTQMWTDREKIAEQGRVARRLVEEQYSLERHYEGLMQIYKRYVI